MMDEKLYKIINKENMDKKNNIFGLRFNGSY